jgi:hypothetical protein
MKNLYMVQVDVAADLDSKDAYLPYTAGVLVSSAWTNEEVKKNYCFKKFIFLREKPDNVLAKMENPGVVAFSNYCWNTEYNKILAEKVKNRYPDCVIIFGGHNVPETVEFLREYRYIDILCFGEGEITFTKLLEGISKGNIEDVKGIAYRDKNGNPVKNKSAEYSADLDFPSPYTDGWFDKLIDEHTEIRFNAILETSRGCPNRCAYCDWGLLSSRTKLAPMEKILAEIQWMSKHKIAFVWGADANFGMFDRDIAIAEALAYAKTQTGYPERMRMNYSKSNHENVFKIIKIFKECNFDRLGATLSFQSLSPVVLKNIGRKNMSDEFFKTMMVAYNRNKMKTYSELIIGLPGETYGSFTKGIAKVFDLGQHFMFDAYNCYLLPNSIMGQPDFIKKYGIKTTRLRIIRSHTESDEFAIPEYSNIITSTNTMNVDDWIRSNVFSAIVKAMHAYGLIRVFAMYNRIFDNVEYDEFYNKLIDYFNCNPNLNVSESYIKIVKHFTEMSVGKDETRMFMDFSGDLVWDNFEYLVLNALRNKDLFYEEMTPFLKQFHYDDGVFDSLMQYQKYILRVPNEEKVTVALNYDINSFINQMYINNKPTLEKKKNVLLLQDEKLMTDWKSFGKYVVWYGRMGWKSYKSKIVKIQ